MPYADLEQRRTYHRQYMSERYQKDKKFRAHQIKKSVKNEGLRRKKVGELLADFKKQGCCLCPEKDPCCMSAHHLDPTAKEFGPGDAKSLGVSLKKVRQELKKCICVCENCHRKIHAGRLNAEVSQLVEEPHSECGC